MKGFREWNSWIGEEKDLFRELGELDNWDLFTDHISQRDVRNIAKALGEEVLDWLGTGSKGVAFKLKSGKVLKITSNEREAAVADRLRKRMTGPHIISFYDVRRLRGENLKDEWPYYSIVMDRVRGLTSEEKLWWGELSEEFFGVSNKVRSDEDWARANDLFMQEVESVVDDPYYQGEGERCEAWWKKLLEQRKSIIEDWEKAGVLGMGYEAHPENVGFDSYGRLVWFDVWGEYREDWESRSLKPIELE